MLVVFVMDVQVAVVLRRMLMQMFVAFCQMQPDARRHQKTGDDELPRNRLALQQQREGGAEEGSD